MAETRETGRNGIERKQKWDSFDRDRYRRNGNGIRDSDRMGRPDQTGPGQT
jgi:hypothetical protein